LRVGTESTNYHITQRDLPASQACHPLLSSYASIHPPSNATTPVRQWYQVTRVAAGPWELPTSYQPSTPPSQTSPQHSPLPNTPSRPRHQYHQSSSRAFGNCLLLANRQWISDNHIIITIRPTPFDPIPPIQTSPQHSPHHPTLHHDQGINTTKVAAGPLGTAYFLPIANGFPTTTSSSPSDRHHPTRPDIPDDDHEYDKDFNQQPSSSRAAGNCLLPVQPPPRPPATHSDTALPPKPLFPTNKLAARPFDTAEASALAN
jgi:hypothetical protein